MGTSIIKSSYEQLIAKDINNNNTQLKSQKLAHDTQIIQIKKSPPFGKITSSCKHFDNNDQLKDMNRFKMKEVKIWYKIDESLKIKYNQDNIIICGFQVKYKDRKGKIYTINSNSEVNGKGRFSKDIILKENEYINSYNIGYDDYIRSIAFTSNFNSFTIGNHLKYKVKTEISTIKDKVISGFYGGFDNGLSYFGVYYGAIRNLYSSYIPYFKLKSRIKAKGAEYFKKFKNIYEQKKFEEKKIDSAASAFMFLCYQPDIIYINIIKFL